MNGIVVLANENVAKQILTWQNSKSSRYFLFCPHLGRRDEKHTHSNNTSSEKEQIIIISISNNQPNHPNKNKILPQQKPNKFICDQT